MGTNEVLAIALAALKKGGGGGGGTSNYNSLTNKPQINDITLQGNKSLEDLGIFDATTLLALEFDDTQDYPIGDVVIHEHKLYQFVSPHTANDPWDITEVTEITVAELVSSIPKAIEISQADYDALTPAEKEDLSKIYYVYDAQTAASGLVIDDNVTSRNSLWSSQKISDEIAGGGGGAVIDDTTTALDKTWSSSKINTELGNKVDAVSGKGLSENDYTDTDKAIVDGVTSALANKVDKVSGKGLSTEDYTTEEQTKLSGIESGAEVNIIESISVNGTAITPDANKNVDITVITNAVNDLINYYKKTETYTKTEVDSLIGAVSTITFDIVSVLPTTNIKTNVIYLVPSSDPKTQNVKDEYINLDGTTSGWEKIGSTDIDLSGYVTTSYLNTILADYVLKSSMGVANGVPTLDVNGKIPSSQLPSLSSAEITAIEGLIDD